MATTTRALVAAFVAVCVVAGCSSSVEVDQVSTDTKRAPAWVTQGIALARTASAKAAERAELPPLPEAEPVPTNSLMPEPQFIAALGALGLDPTAASCIYRGIEGTPLADTVGKLLTAASDPVAAATSGAIDEGTQRQMLVALAPCLDTSTLLTVLAAVTGIGGKSPTGDGSMNALVGAVAGRLASGAVGGDAANIAKQAGINLTPAQFQALAAAIAGRGTNVVDTSKIDFSKLDVTQLTKEQIVTLLVALLRGLTPAQQEQLGRLTAVDLKSLNLDVDTSKLSKQEAGALFVVLLPFISAGIAAPKNEPPPGVDPGQIYIPPGTDLSAINPLNFVSKENLIEGLGTQYNIPPNQAGCIYDRLRLIDPRLIGEAYLGRSEQGAAQIVLAFVSCVVATG